MIQLKRVYDPMVAGDGRRYLVERLWPRGVKKESLALAGWLKELAPSSGLRQWYGHDFARWEEFRRRYRAELADSRPAWEPLLQAGRRGNVTLLFGSRDREHCSARVLKEFLDERLAEQDAR